MSRSSSRSPNGPPAAVSSGPAGRSTSVIAACIIIIFFCTITFSGCTAGSGSRPLAHLGENTGKLSVYFLDVGQGDSELVLFGNRTILIDAGEIDMGDRVVADLKALGVQKIDLLVATHPHSDHIGGMKKVLDAFPVGQVLDSGLPHPSPLYTQFLETIEARHIPYRVAEQGQSIDPDPELRIFVLSPPKERFGDDPNTNSVVLRISYGTIDFLLNGDMSNEAEAALLKTGYALDAEILKIGHHGSRTSTSPGFLSRVNPEVAVIEVGRDNPYGHPHDETIKRLDAAGITVYRTDLNGTVLVRTDGVSYSVATAKGGSGTPVTFQPATTATRAPAGLLNAGVTVPAIPENISVAAIAQNISVPAAVANFSVPVPSLTYPAIQLGNASAIAISAVQFDAPGDDRQNLNGEWVRLTNRGDGPVLMSGWTLTDRTGSSPYRFPAIVLLPSASVTVYTGSGMMNDTALFMGRSEPLWGNSGDTAILRDGSGAIVDQRSGGSA